MPEWTSIDMEDTSGNNEKSTTPNSKPNESLEVLEDSETDDFEDTNELKFIIPSAKKIRQATLDGIKIGILPEYQDYSVVLEYLVKQFTEKNYKFHDVMNTVPWLGEWLTNPFNANLLNDDLELAAKLEASRIHKQIQHMLQGGVCSKTCGKFFACICCCLPPVSILCKMMFYCVDLLIGVCWATFFDWWLGTWCRQYILTHLTYIPIYVRIKLENWLIGDSLFQDEELSIKNIYDSNSYRIANQYACLLCLAITLTILGFSMVVASYIYLQIHPDQLFIKVESILGIVLLSVGLCGLQFYCRCTL